MVYLYDSTINHTPNIGSHTHSHMSNQDATELIAQSLFASNAKHRRHRSLLKSIKNSFVFKDFRE